MEESAEVEIAHIQLLCPPPQRDPSAIDLGGCLKFTAVS
jgi:hypothetical protein